MISMVDTLGGPPPGGARPAEVVVVVVVGTAGTARFGVSWTAVVASAGVAAGVLWEKSTDDCDWEATGFPGRVGGTLTEEEDDDDDNGNGGAAMAMGVALASTTADVLGDAAGVADSVVRVPSGPTMPRVKYSVGCAGGSASVVVVTAGPRWIEKCIPSSATTPHPAAAATLAIDADAAAAAAAAADCDNAAASPWPDTPVLAPS